MVRQRQAELHSRQVGAAKVGRWLEESEPVTIWSRNDGLMIGRSETSRSQFGHGALTKSRVSKPERNLEFLPLLSLCNTLYTCAISPLPPTHTEIGEGISRIPKA